MEEAATQQEEAAAAVVEEDGAAQQVLVAAAAAAAVAAAAAAAAAVVRAEHTRVVHQEAGCWAQMGHCRQQIYIQRPCLQRLCLRAQWAVRLVH